MFRANYVTMQRLRTCEMLTQLLSPITDIILLLSINQDQERQAAETRYSELSAALVEAEKQLASTADLEHVEALKVQLAAALQQVTQPMRPADHAQNPILMSTAHCPQ